MLCFPRFFLFGLGLNSEVLGPTAGNTNRKQHKRPVHIKHPGMWRSWPHVYTVLFQSFCLASVENWCTISALCDDHAKWKRVGLCSIAWWTLLNCFSLFVYMNLTTGPKHSLQTNDAVMYCSLSIWYHSACVKKKKKKKEANAQPD